MRHSPIGEQPLEKSLKAAAVAAGIIAALIGGGFFIAWMTGSMTHAGFRVITMKTNAALALVLGGAALALVVPADPGGLRRLLVGVLAGCALVIGALTLSEHVLGLELGIDQLLAHEPPGAVGVLHPNRMGPPGATSFTLCGLSILLLLIGKAATIRVAQRLGIALCLIGLLGMVGYLFGADTLYGAARYTVIAWQTTIAIFLLGTGILLARPTHGLMAAVTSPDAGGVAIRRLLIPGAVLPVLLALLRLEGERLGLYDRYFGTSILVLSWIIIFSLLVYRTGVYLSSLSKDLEVQRQLLESIINQLPVGVLIIRSSDLRVLVVNPAYAHLAPGKEMLHKTIEEIWPEIQPDLGDLFRQVARSGKPYHAFDEPFLIRRATDQPLEERSFTWSLVPVQLPGNAGDGLLVTISETSQRKRTEKALRQSENRLRNIIENMAEGLVVIDPDGGALLWNRKALEMHGATGDEDELASMASLASRYEVYTLGGDPVPTDQRPETRLMRGESLDHVDLVVTDSIAGWQRIFSFSGTLVREVDGKPLMGILNIRDITDTKRAEEALRESEELLRTVLETLPVAVWILGSDGMVLHANQAAQEIWAGVRFVGIDQFGEYIGWWPDSGRQLAAGEWAGARAITRGEITLNEEVEIQCFDGSHKVILNSAVPIRNAKGEITGAITIHQDITARRHAEEELRRAKDELEIRVRERTRELEQAYDNLTRETEERIAAVEHLRRSEQLLVQQSRMAAMGEMLGNIAHQWRQPLNILGLLIQALPLSLELGALTREALENEVAKAMRLILHMSQTINDFRDFLQEEKEKKPFSVNHAVATTISLFEASLKTLEVEVEVREGEELVVEGHRNEFSQVVINIITNARDAFRERNVQSPRITIELFKEKGRAVVTIADNAGGIPEAIVDRIFEPYFTTKGPDKGTGIGLFMSKNIIEKSMGGSLTVRNAGEGAEFRIELAGEVDGQGRQG